MVLCGAVRCGVVWCGVVWCGVVGCGAVWCGVVWTKGDLWYGVGVVNIVVTCVGRGGPERDGSGVGMGYMTLKGQKSAAQRSPHQEN